MKTLGAMSSFLLSFLVSCSPQTGQIVDADLDTQPIDADAVHDVTTESDDAQTDADSDDGGFVPRAWCEEASYIWIANSDEGTLSKLCTLDGVEIGLWSRLRSLLRCRIHCRRRHGCGR